MRSRWLDIGQVLFFFAFLWTKADRGPQTPKKEQDQYQAILTEQAWSIKDLLLGFRGNFSYGIQWVVPSRQDSTSHLGSQSQSRIWFILPAHGASHIIRVILDSTYSEFPNFFVPADKK